MKLTSSNQKVSVATKDRIVYKVVEKSDDTTFVAPYTKSVYEAGKSYSANLELNQAGDTVKKGLFVLTNKKAVRRHLNKKHKFYSPLKVAISCVIPSGTKYYFNPQTKEAMAENLIVEGEVSVKRKRS